MSRKNIVPKSDTDLSGALYFISAQKKDLEIKSRSHYSTPFALVTPIMALQNIPVLDFGRTRPFKMIQRLFF